MVSVHDSGLSGPGLRPSQGQCVVFIGKTLHSHSASLSPCVMLGVTLRWTSIPFLVASCYGNRDKLWPDGPLGSYAGFYILLNNLHL